MLCCSALKIYLLCSILYAQEQEMWSNYYVIYVQVYMNNLILLLIECALHISYYAGIIGKSIYSHLRNKQVITKVHSFELC